MQAAAMQIIYKGVFQWFLKLVVGVQCEVGTGGFAR